MDPRPVYEWPDNNHTSPYQRLAGQRTLITGGDSGIGRAVACAFAKEGADVAIVYLNEHGDAAETKQAVEAYGRKCATISADVGNEEAAIQSVEEAVKFLGGLDVVVNNAAEQHAQNGLEFISSQQLEKTFRTNIFSFFYITRAALAHLKAGASIVNTASITAYQGHEKLIDYSATKGAIVTFTRSLAKSLAPRQIRVNAVAPGPIWTPLIPSTFTETEVMSFGSDTPLGRAGQPVEVAPAYVYLASRDSTYVTGQVIHVNGGHVVNG